MPWESLTDEQLEIRELVRTLARERIAPRAAEIDASHEFPWDVVELFREHEIFGLLFDEAYGGTGTGTLLSLVAIEEVSKVCATSGLILAVQELGSLGLKVAGSARQVGFHVQNHKRWVFFPAGEEVVEPGGTVAVNGEESLQANQKLAALLGRLQTRHNLVGRGLLRE